MEPDYIEEYKGFKMEFYKNVTGYEIRNKEGYAIVSGFIFIDPNNMVTDEFKLCVDRALQKKRENNDEKFIRNLNRYFPIIYFKFNPSERTN